MIMQKLEFIFGADYNKDGKLIRRSEKMRAFDEIRTLAVELYGGCTMTHGHGNWKGKSGRVVSEKSCILTILNEETDMKTIGILANKIRTVLRQEAVIFTVSKVEVVFFS